MNWSDGLEDCNKRDGAKEKRDLLNRCSLCEEKHYPNSVLHYCGTVDGGEVIKGLPRLDIILCPECRGSYILMDGKPRLLFSDMNAFNCRCMDYGVD